MIIRPPGSIFTEYKEIVKMGDSSGSLFLPDVTIIGKAALVISNLSDGIHDPEDYDWSGSDYSLNVDQITDLKTTIALNKTKYVIGDNLRAELLIINPRLETTVDVAAALMVNGYLFFYPDWTREFKKVTKSIDDSSIYQEVILEFPISDENFVGEYTFYSALFDTETGELIGELSQTDFSISRQNPTAVFDVFPNTGNIDTIFAFNGSKSYDAQDPTEHLQVRWDWENDGEWDTEYSIRKVTFHEYATPGTKTVKMEIIDLDGYTGQTTRKVEVTGN